MNAEMKLLFEVLGKMEPVGPNETTSALEERFAKFSRLVKKLAAALFILLLALAGWKIAGGDLSPFFIGAARIIGFGSMVSAIFFVFIDILPIFLLMLNFRNDAMRRFLIEVEFDMGKALELRKFSSEHLRLAQQIFETKIARIQARLMMFLGGPDKIAIMSLATMGWAAWNEFPNVESSIAYNALYFGVAFLGGLSIGGVMLNVVMQRYAYYVELIKFSLSPDFSTINAHCFYGVPIPSLRWKAKKWIGKCMSRIKF